MGHVVKVVNISWCFIVLFFAVHQQQTRLKTIEEQYLNVVGLVVVEKMTFYYFLL